MIALKGLIEICMETKQFDDIIKCFQSGGKLNNPKAKEQSLLNHEKYFNFELAHILSA